MAGTVTLVTVAVGEPYEQFADDLFRSALTNFLPGMDVSLLMLPGSPGWPEATITRHKILSERMPLTDWVFLIDADMRIDEVVGPEILPVNGITATQHPGYTSSDPINFPYERNPISAARIPPGDGTMYYCGGFIGGTYRAMVSLTAAIAEIVDADRENDHVPLWHDESALNHILAYNPPEKVLPPAYCHPEDDSFYRSYWTERYQRIITALDKTPEQRGIR